MSSNLLEALDGVEVIGGGSVHLHDKIQQNLSDYVSHNEAAYSTTASFVHNLSAVLQKLQSVLSNHENDDLVNAKIANGETSFRVLMMDIVSSLITRENEPLGTSFYLIAHQQDATHVYLMYNTNNIVSARSIYDTKNIFSNSHENVTLESLNEIYLPYRLVREASSITLPLRLFTDTENYLSEIHGTVLQRDISRKAKERQEGRLTRLRGQKEKRAQAESDAMIALHKTLDVVNGNYELIGFSEEGTAFNIDKFKETSKRFMSDNANANKLALYPFKSIEAFIYLARVKNVEVYVEDIRDIFVESLEMFIDQQSLTLIGVDEELESSKDDFELLLLEHSLDFDK